MARIEKPPFQLSVLLPHTQWLNSGCQPILNDGLPSQNICLPAPDKENQYHIPLNLSLLHMVHLIFHHLHIHCRLRLYLCNHLQETTEENDGNKDKKIELDAALQCIQAEQACREKKRHLFSAIGILLVVAAISVLIATRLVPVLQVSGKSMEPALENGELVVIKKTTKINITFP